MNPRRLTIGVLALFALCPREAHSDECRSISIHELQVSCNATHQQGGPYELPLLLGGVDVITPRLPAVWRHPPELPKSCRKAVDDLRDKWTKDDICEWGTLSKHSCSHQLGWSEIKPGTCTAGGPPPICKEPHWEKAPFNSLQQLAREQERVRRLRGIEHQQAIASACDCWAADIDKESREDSWMIPGEMRLHPDRVTKQAYSACSILGCPPGTTCHNGECHETRVLDRVVDTASEKLGKELLKWLGVASKVRAAIKLAQQVFGATPVHHDYLSYNGIANDYLNSVEQLGTLAREFDTAIYGSPPRPLAAIKADIRKIGEELEQKFKAIETASQVSLSGLTAYQCPQVFAARHRRFVEINSTLRSTIREMSEQK